MDQENILWKGVAYRLTYVLENPHQVGSEIRAQTPYGFIYGNIIFGHLNLYYVNPRFSILSMSAKNLADVPIKERYNLQFPISLSAIPHTFSAHKYEAIKLTLRIEHIGDIIPYGNSYLSLLQNIFTRA